MTPLGDFQPIWLRRSDVDGRWYVVEVSGPVTFRQVHAIDELPSEPPAPPVVGEGAEGQQFKIGDRVELRASSSITREGPEWYATGTVTEVGWADGMPGQPLLDVEGDDGVMYQKFPINLRPAPSVSPTPEGEK